MKEYIVQVDTRRGILFVSGDMDRMLTVVVPKNPDPYELLDMTRFCLERYKQGAEGVKTWHSACEVVGVLIGERLYQRTVSEIVRHLYTSGGSIKHGVTVVDVVEECYSLTLVLNFTPLGVILSGVN